MSAVDEDDVNFPGDAVWSGPEENCSWLEIATGSRRGEVVLPEQMAEHLCSPVSHHVVLLADLNYVKSWSVLHWKFWEVSVYQARRQRQSLVRYLGCYDVDEQLFSNLISRLV